MNKKPNPPSHITLLIIVAALGYFVDIYDLLLFSIVRIPSLLSLGLHGQDVTDSGIFLLNIQMIGLLAGGIFRGIVGDKKGRLSVLFGSIFLYSIAFLSFLYFYRTAMVYKLIGYGNLYFTSLTGRTF